MATDWRLEKNKSCCLYSNTFCWIEHHRNKIAFISTACLCGALFCLVAYLVTIEALNAQEETIDQVRITALRERIKAVEDTSERQWTAVGTLQTDMAAVKADIASMKDAQTMNTHLLYTVIGALAIKIALELLGRKTFTDREEERET